MTSAERTTWIYGILAVVIPVVYFVTIFGQLPTTDVSDIGYAAPLLIAIGAAIAGAIVLNIAVALLTRDHDKTDERDKQISILSERVGFYVFSVLVLAALLLVLVDVDPFWVGNALYAAFTLTAVAQAVSRIVAYRKGL